MTVALVYLPALLMGAAVVRYLAPVRGGSLKSALITAVYGIVTGIGGGALLFLILRSVGIRSGGILIAAELLIAAAFFIASRRKSVP
ncbi:MAG TPA: hypothetical protein VEJ63_21620, partial [Planctomycetota bacterium]|nr:hypothetical protein [Planctomycetota bacterium]